MSSVKDVEKATTNLNELKSVWSEVTRVSNALNSIWDGLQSNSETEDTMPAMALFTVLDMVDSISIKLHRNVTELIENLGIEGS